MNRFFLMFFTVVCITAQIANSGIISFRIEAFIDGKDLLYIKDNTLQWKHQDYAAVGRMSGHNYPTIVSSQIDGVSYLNKYEWTPTWPEMPPAEIRYPAVSNIFEGLVPSLLSASDIVLISLNPIQSRAVLTVSQFPTVSNQGYLVVEFNDNDPMGAEWYIADITIEYIPEPCTFLLLGLGGFVLRRGVRQQH